MKRGLGKGGFECGVGGIRVRASPSVVNEFVVNEEIVRDAIHVRQQAAVFVSGFNVSY